MNDALAFKDALDDLDRLRSALDCLGCTGDLDTPQLALVHLMQSTTLLIGDCLDMVDDLDSNAPATDIGEDIQQLESAIVDLIKSYDTVKDFYRPGHTRQ